MDLASVLEVIDDVKARFQREEDQGIEQQRMDKAIAALAGKQACTRISDELMRRKAMLDNMRSVVEMERRERA